ncbi:MAG: hypothetical protein IBJ11_06410 [Phycisphaerales bacterium]|nr:hypothetical protein [Phycisphaerales bacterium]
MGSTMINVLGAAVLGVVALVALVMLIVPLLRGIGWLFVGIGWLIAHVFRYVFGTLGDLLRFVGAIITALLFAPLTLVNVVIGRWSASAHYGRALTEELGVAGRALYRVVIGHPARLLLLTPLVERFENRLPEAMAAAPTADRPKGGKGGLFEGYRIVGSLPGGGSGGKLYVAELEPAKRAAIERQGITDIDQVVVKSFSLADGSSLPQIIRESRALEAARRLNLILDHELTNERFYYVMPYVPGEDLTTVTRKLHASSGPEGLAAAQLKAGLSHVADLLSTLEYYHRGGLWHKDVKPDNIIVSQGRAHLVDLGLVTPLRSAMTLTTHGTEYFRDPELVRMALRGAKVLEVDGVKFDVYGAAAVLYSVVENSFPAHGGLSQIGKRCPEALRWIIRRGMADLNQRYASAAEMLADVRAVADAADPMALKPVDLPSMQGLSAAAVAAATPIEPPPLPHFGPAPSPAAGPAPAGARAAGAFAAAAGIAGAAGVGAPKIKVYDWLTGRYRVDDAGAAAAPQAAAFAGTPRRTPTGRSAGEQLRAARERVRTAQARVGRRLGGRGPRYSNAPNAGVVLAVMALVGIVAVVIAFFMSQGRVMVRNNAVAGTPMIEFDTEGRPLSIRLGSRFEPAFDGAQLSLDLPRLKTDVRMALENLTKEATAKFNRGLTKPRWVGNGGVGPADNLSEIQLRHRAIAVVSFLPVGVDSPAQRTLDAMLADLRTATGLVGRGLTDSDADIRTAAELKTIIGAASPDDDEVRGRLREWLRPQNYGGDVLSTLAVLWVPREGTWRLIASPSVSDEEFGRLAAAVTRAAQQAEAASAAPGAQNRTQPPTGPAAAEPAPQAGPAGAG